MTTTLSLEELSDENKTLLDRLNTIHASMHAISEAALTSGMSKDLAMTIEAYSQGSITNVVSLESFTKYPSETNLTLSLEILGKIKSGLVKAALMALAATVVGIVVWIIKSIREYFNRKKAYQLLERTRSESKLVAAFMTFYSGLSPEVREVLETAPDMQIARERFDSAITVFLYEIAEGKWKKTLEDILLPSRGNMLGFLSQHITSNLDGIWKLAEHVTRDDRLGGLLDTNSGVMSRIREVHREIDMDVALCKRVRFGGALTPKFGEDLDSVLTRINEEIDIKRVTAPSNFDDSVIGRLTYRSVIDNAVKVTLSVSADKALKDLEELDKRLKQMRSDIVIKVAQRSSEATEEFMSMIYSVNELIELFNKGVSVGVKTIQTPMFADEEFVNFLDAIITVLKAEGVDVAKGDGADKAFYELFMKYKG